MKKLAKKDEQLIVILLTIVIIAAIYYLMIIPFKDKLVDMNLRKDVARDEYLQLILANKNPGQFKEDLKNLLEGIEAKDALIPESISELQLRVRAEEIKKLLPKGELKSHILGDEKYKEIVRNKIVFSFSTTYERLESLINSIVNMPEKIGVDNIKFTIDNNKLVGTMDVYIYSKNKA